MCDVLVVIEHSDLRLAVLRVLERGGYTPWVPAEGGATLDHVGDGAFDAVVVDPLRQDPDGLQVLAHARNASRPVRSLVMLGEGVSPVPGRAPAWWNVVSADRFLYRPFTAGALLAAMAALTERTPRPVPAWLGLDAIPA